MKAFLFGCVAGVLCQLWGVLGLFGFRGLAGPGLTLGAISFVLLSQTVIRWLSTINNRPGSLVLTILVTFMLLATLALLGWMLPREEFPEPGSNKGIKKPEAGAAPRKSP